MKRVFILLVSLFAMMAASMSAKAQEVAIELIPGWNWIAYPYAETVDLNTALGSFTPAIGDRIRSQYGASNYTYGRWRGAVKSMNAGEGYQYFSTRTEPVILVFGLPPMPMGTLTVTTSEPTNVTSTTAVCGGSAVSNDGTTILMKGVCWATHPEPTTNDSYLEIESGPGTFTATMTELTPETVYYVRAYAVSVKGINYGEELSFTTVPQGILNGLFSVGESTQVCFSQGNLQYQASTNTWRFAENQWDYVGNSELGTVYENGVICDNSLISSSYNGWIDLFGWGTSGHDHGAVCYQPWSTNENNGEYVAYGKRQSNLFDQTGQADWGSNAISNGGNQPNQWRTLTSNEWVYLFDTRNTASGIRWTMGNVNGVNGVILLPDNWDASNYSLNDANGGYYSSNSISAEDWTNQFEDNGAVFFPTAAQRVGTWVRPEGDYNYDFGVYWSSSWCNDDNAYNVYLNPSGLDVRDNWQRCVGRSVRLVRPAQANVSYSIEAVPNSAEGGTITGTATYNYYEQVTLTANANEGYTFYQWKENGNVISTENPISFVALFDRNLEACFYENTTYPLLYSYNDDDHTATVIGHWDGQNATGDLVIPEIVMHNGETYTVTAIGEWAFNESALSSVVIPNTVISIEDRAFSGCRRAMTSVTLSNSLVSIGNAAFNYCSCLSSIELPNSLTSIGEAAFEACPLSSLIIPSSVTSIGNMAFFGCGPSLSQIIVETGNGYYDSRDNCNAIIETSSNKLIQGCRNTIIPNTVTVIGGLAMSPCALTSITIPSSVTLLETWAFRDNPLTSITVLAETPPILDYVHPFEDIDRSIPVFIPCGSLEAYQNAYHWNEFTNFVKMCPGVVTVTANHEEYGTVSGGGSFEAGETCTVTATPNEGYYFLCWMENGQVVSTEATYTFPVYRDHDMTAIFYATLGEETVINGDFEQGNVGFTSEYEYNYDFGPGGYYVDNNAHGYPGFGHGGTGNFMLIDAATEPDVIVWTEEISVVPNTYYSLSAWVCTLFEENRAVLQFSINGTQIGDVFTAPSQTNTWQQFSAIWYSGNSTTATITIIDQNTEYWGNDFGLDDISFRELDPSAGSDHAYVDLGLPSGLLWATCNVGADSPEDYGDYFAWGETTPKSNYDWNTYQYCMGSENTLTKYCNNSSYGFNGFTDNLTTLLPEDDAATANWGSEWRMPTYDEWQELYNNTTCTWTTQNGVNGRLFTASNGNSLFLPAAGYRSGDGLFDVGNYGFYWSNSLDMDYPNSARIFYINSNYYGPNGSTRDYGRSVRAVRSSAQN